MPTDHRAKLATIKRFDQLIAYLRDEMGWPIGRDSFEEVDDLFYEFTADELGIDPKTAAKIQEIKRLRPLSAKQPWGIFFIKFEPKRLPVVALRRILGQVALKKRASANSAERAAVDAALDKAGIKLPAADLKVILRAVSERDENAPPVIAKDHKPGKAKADPLRSLFEAKVDGKATIVEYEPDSDLRDTEQVPLLEEGGVEAYIRREVLASTSDAWIKEDSAKIGYEISLTRHFYRPQPLRTLEEISADIVAIEKESEGLLDEIIKKGK
jgi:hypothetical protein